MLCCSHGYLEQYGGVKKIAELANHNCVRHVNYPYGDDWRFADRRGATTSVRISGNLITNSGEALRSAALQGSGICLAAGFMVRDDLEAGRLVRLLPEYRSVELAMNAIYPHRHNLSAKVRIFIEFLVKHSANLEC